MLDKDLFRLARGSGKYVAIAVAVSVVAMLLNLAITACICVIIALAAEGAQADAYLAPALLAAAGVLLRIPAGIAVQEISPRQMQRIKRKLMVNQSAPRSKGKKRTQSKDLR